MNWKVGQLFLLHLLFPVLFRHQAKDASNQNHHPSLQLQYPTTDDIGRWRAYWQEHNQSWRIEPEINRQRQKELDRLRTTSVDIEKGIYPFKRMKIESC